MQPLITVYMPTANRLGLLKRAVASVFAQTYQNIELIIVDDASTDETWQYLSELQASHENVRCFRQEKSQGACAARNIAINNASGQYITGIDDDDEFLPERLALLQAAYEPQYAFVCHGFIWHFGNKSKEVDNQARLISLPEQLNYNYASNQIFTETEKLRVIGGFDQNFFACQDYDTWTRLLIQFGNAKRIDGASYVLHQGHEGPRVTAKPNKIKGYQQFYDKHVNHMSDKNKKNQAFMRRTAAQESYSLFELFSDMKFGFFQRKCRYWIASCLPQLAQLRREWLKKN